MSQYRYHTCRCFKSTVPRIRKYTDVDTTLSVHLQFYLFSRYESSLFSCKYTDIDTYLSVYLQFYLFLGNEKKSI